ncbi:sulfatase [Algoriphagus marincola]|uniref:Sulfatase n=1 Tax=Algoriphagus marincola TaxID=264027 RepID=A0ABS7N009_9BACT|nr:sulfatase [Algoriphagus marincola]MBY5949649.1 sulfatase [Algoriphagus marincola]
MKKITLALGLLALFSACQEKTQKSENPSPKKPNIILIFADDLGYGDLESYGATQWTTPHLNQLAQEGTQMNRFYVPHAVCSASRAALLTGAYANRLGIYGAYDHTAKQGLHPAEETIAEILKAQGYATGMVGKWHLGHLPEFLPTRQGFDSYYGLPYSNDMWPHHPEVKDYYPPLPLLQNEEIIDTLDEQSQLTTLYTEKALEFIDQNSDQPFFLYLAHSMPHVPLYVSEKFAGQSEQGLYGDVIMEIDWSVGQVHQKIKDLGLEENTMIIFTSDNGPWLSYGGHAGLTGGLREGKGTSWDGGIRVPAIFKWTGKIPEGKTIENPAMSIDVLPTIAEITESLLPEKPIDGESIWPLLTQGKAKARPYFAYYNRNELQAVFYENWKLVFPHRYRTIPKEVELRNDGIPVKYDHINLEKMELYDLTSDPYEQVDQASKHPEIVQKLNEMADQARKDMGDALTDSQETGQREVGRVQ